MIPIAAIQDMQKAGATAREIADRLRRAAHAAEKAAREDEGG
jgi:hypothetical protein